MQADRVATPLKFADSFDLDSFGRLRVGLPKLRFSSIFDTSNRAIFWSESIAGGAASFLPGKSAVELSVSGPAQSVIRQTKEYFVYRAGQSQLVFMTYYSPALPTDTFFEVGYFDDDNGIFIRMDSGGPSLVLRSSVSGSIVDTVVPQDSWNIDKLDGAGRSGHTFNSVSTQILVIDLQWLGVGRVRVGFDIDGAAVPAHEFLNANMGQSDVYMRLAKLPLRYQVRSGSSGGAAAAKQICATVVREGGDDEPNIGCDAALSADATVGTVWTAVLGIRAKASDIRATLRLAGASVFNRGTNDLEFAVALNPTLAAAPGSWTDRGVDSAAEFARHTSTVSLTAAGDPDAYIYPIGGFAAGGGGPSSGDNASGAIGETVPAAADYAGTPDEIWLLARNIDSGSALLRGHVMWNEER